MEGSLERGVKAFRRDGIGVGVPVGGLGRGCGDAGAFGDGFFVCQRVVRLGVRVLGTEKVVLQGSGELPCSTILQYYSILQYTTLFQV